LDGKIFVIHILKAQLSTYSWIIKKPRQSYIGKNYYLQLTKQ